MIWREHTCTKQEVAGLPQEHTCVVTPEDEETFSWFVQVEGDGEDDDDNEDKDEDEDEDDDDDGPEVERPWCCLSVRGTSGTIELARVAAERAYRDLIVAYERLTSSRLDT